MAERRTEYIKVNIPETMESYIAGFGEGVFVLVDTETKEAYDADATEGVYQGTLDNYCLYWNGLMPGETIPFEMRGDRRPVVLFDWLNSNYTINKAFFEEVDLDE